MPGRRAGALLSRSVSDGPGTPGPAEPGDPPGSTEAGSGGQPELPEAGPGDLPELPELLGQRGTEPEGPLEPGRAAERSEPAEAGGGERKVPGGHQIPGLYQLARAGFIEYDRIVFFSDAVFAIAITLLAINLRVPRHLPSVPGGPVLHHEVPAMVGFGISFLVIGLFWLGHHGIFRYITALDRPLIGLNLLLLGTIAFLPYPTEVLESPSLNGSVPVVFYSICAGAAGLAELAVWLYATRPGAGLADPSVAQVKTLFTLRIARVPAVFFLSVPVALVSPGNAPFSWLAIWLLGVGLNRFFRVREARQHAGFSNVSGKTG